MEKRREPLMKVGAHDIEITHPDKILFPEDGITKSDLIEYYRNVADVILPYLKDRPLVMNRYPNGIDKSWFVQQSISDYFPKWIDRVELKKEGGRITHVVCQNAATLVYLANQNCITFHTWLSKRDLLENPDLMVFDLDPSDRNFEKVKEAAALLKSFLLDLGLDPLVKSTGSRGLHVILPLNRKASFAEVHNFAHDIAELVVRRESEKLTIEQRKDKRHGRVLVDYMRNSYGQLLVAPYSVRAKPGAPVAIPLDWEEAFSPGIDPRSFTIKNVLGRLAKKGDPWIGRWTKRFAIDKASRKLRELKIAGSR
jgi:bifunctional non-homologous end joining protein LigD